MFLFKTVVKPTVRSFSFSRRNEMYQEGGAFKHVGCDTRWIYSACRKMSVNHVKKLELTFAILKPHITAVPQIVKDIQNMILSNGFYIIRTKKNLLDMNQAHEFYDEHRDKFFFNRLVTFMCSGQCFFHILARENAIQAWRTMMGPTKVFKTLYSHPETIRGIHGLTDTRNATHGSDSPESAEREMKVLFPEFSVSDWYKNEHEKFLNGEYEFNSEEFVHVPKKVS